MLIDSASCELANMSEPKEKEDPIKLHKEANTLFEAGKYKKAEDVFLRTAELYKKVQNFFDATTMYYRAGEAAYMMKEYEEALQNFLKSADLSFEKKFDRFAVSALEYARDCYKALKKAKEVKETEKKIKETKKKLEEAF